MPSPRRNGPARHGDASPHSGEPRLVPVGWDALPDWEGDDHASALIALRRTARHVGRDGPHKTGRLHAALGGSGVDFVPALAASLEADGGTARLFFEEWFAPHLVAGSGLGGPDGGGLVTGFYEPNIRAAPERSADYRHPIYAPPPDLVRNDGTLPTAADLPADHAWGMERDARLYPAPDRGAIEAGGLADAGPYRDWPVIAWAADRVDLYFAHIQGAARLVMPDGSVRRITYAAKSGHPFTGIGSVLRERGALADVSMATIRQWLAAHPDEADAVMRLNRSFIFFREEPVDDPRLGPVAAARVPLHPGRSLAVDRRLHGFGTPIHVHAPALDWDGAPFSRLMIAQETGTAIVGAARGDIFTGSGETAGDRAGGIVATARFVALLPRPQAAP